MEPFEPMLESEEAARRLGVKVATLYAYVSRGLLGSHPAPGSRRSLFALSEVEALARRSRRGRRSETRLATVTTAVTQLRDDGPAYRGVPATLLASTSTYEEVAHLLWGSERPVGPEWSTPVVAAPPEGLAPLDRVRWATVMAGAADPLRDDDRPEAVMTAARRLISAMVASLAGAEPSGGQAPPATGDGGGGGIGPSGVTVAGRLCAALQPRRAAGCEPAVDAALVLLADHELATSTVAVRVAASTRADLYCAVLSGLGTMAGPLHGGASTRVRHLLEQAEQVGPERACNDALRWHGSLPGFGHTVYRHGDPRLAPLLAQVQRHSGEEQRGLIDAVTGLAASTGHPAPNVDLGLGALTWAAGLAADAGPAIFTVARVAGWTAHYLEELAEAPLRFRARAVYASAHRPAPPSGTGGQGRSTAQPRAQPPPVGGSADQPGAAPSGEKSPVPGSWR